MKTVLILGNRAKQAVARAAERIEAWLSERATVRVELDPEAELGEGEVDFAVALGGDGSVLQAARKLAPRDVPLLGVNVGKFGFLTETVADECESVLADVLEGRFRLAERMMISCVLEREGKAVLETVGLNDAVLSRTSLSRIITIDLQVDGELVTTYRADGLIVATPVGSTAHSLASGGPIIYPEMEALVVTPICPHTLSNRPLVLPPDLKVTLQARQWAQKPALTVDGQVNEQIEEGDLVRIRKAPRPVKLIQTGRNRFFATLRNKLDWRGQPRYVT
ncbi:MAG: NAD(+)/NADH kinase [Planctomycetota bacterium]|jgi:NAD+ kinase